MRESEQSKSARDAEMRERSIANEGCSKSLAIALRE